MLRIFKIVRSVRLSKTSSRVSRSSLDFILTRRSLSLLSSRFLSFSSILSDKGFTPMDGRLLILRGRLGYCKAQVEFAEFAMFEQRFRCSLENSGSIHQEICRVSYLEGPSCVLLHEQDSDVRILRKVCYRVEDLCSNDRSQICRGLIKHDGIGLPQ